jgi:hypothetical protein
MAQPTWNTPKSNLGLYNAAVGFAYNLSADANYPASYLRFKLLNGSLPDGLSVNTDGEIRGTPKPVTANTVYTFTIRVTDNLGEIRDRTFSITILGELKPAFTTPSGNILTVDDSTWVELQLKYTNPIDKNSTQVRLLSGKLPLGLEIDKLGLIRGYARPPLTVTHMPDSKKYKFSVELTNDLGTAIATYDIVINNQLLTNRLTDSRPPTILNFRPMSLLVNKDDPNYQYYLKSDSRIPIIKSGDYFSFKILGHDFDESVLVYEFYDLPFGLQGDTTTGWITGNPTLNVKGLGDYYFTVRVKKADKPVYSDMLTFILTISRDVDPKITWKSNSNLGVINNNTISDIRLSATASVTLAYELVSGELPPNLTLLDNGDIVGKIVNQPTDKFLKHKERAVFNFDVRAYSPDFPIVENIKKFTLTVYQFYDVPTETMYFKATPKLADRKVIQTLLTDNSLIPTEFLYRPTDRYFGKAKDVVFVQVYGINASTIEKYITAIGQNHYWRNVILGELKTAVAKDDFGNVMYEVVYSEVIDDLENNKGQSVNSIVRWNRYIDLNRGPWIASEGEVYTSYEEDKASGTKYTTNLSPGYIVNVYPASFQNMRKQIASVLDENFDSRLLPRWMRSQQASGSIPGYVQAWVLCYTLPGKAEIIKNNINSNWNHKLNEIHFELDRYTVDKSSTYDFNTYLATPTWQNLPSSPNLTTLDSHDFYVLFPKKTIRPN